MKTGSVRTECRMAVHGERREEFLKLKGTFKIMSSTNLLHQVTKARREGLSKLIQLVNN